MNALQLQENKNRQVTSIRSGFRSLLCVVSDLILLIVIRGSLFVLKFEGGSPSMVEDPDLLGGSTTLPLPYLLAYSVRHGYFFLSSLVQFYFVRVV